MTTDIDGLIERLRGYNPPDRTFYSEMQTAADIHEAAEALATQEVEISDLESIADRLYKERDVARQENERLQADIARYQTSGAELHLALEKVIAERDALRKALEAIMHAVKTPPWTNMSRSDMREIARAALAAQEPKT